MLFLCITASGSNCHQLLAAWRKGGNHQTSHQASPFPQKGTPLSSKGRAPFIKRCSEHLSLKGALRPWAPFVKRCSPLLSHSLSCAPVERSDWGLTVSIVEPGPCMSSSELLYLLLCSWRKAAQAQVLSGHPLQQQALSAHPPPQERRSGSCSSPPFPFIL